MYKRFFLLLVLGKSSVAVAVVSTQGMLKVAVVIFPERPQSWSIWSTSEQVNGGLREDS